MFPTYFYKIVFCDRDETLCNQDPLTSQPRRGSTQKGRYSENCTEEGREYQHISYSNDRTLHACSI